MGATNSLVAARTVTILLMHLDDDGTASID